MQLDSVPVAYEENRGRIAELFGYLRASRKYGFPLVCSIAGKPHEVQLMWAMRYLLFVCKIELDAGVPNEEFVRVLAQADNPLREDAVDLLSLACGNTAEIALIPDRPSHSRDKG